ncbi:hypothetical protein OG870_17300 [Streptomyces sp. NBC_00461]|uniref:hypothetical protein n=1 Tax=Streptomyces sp. NBC_00461 TaxID=2975750 RepID=UPI002E19288A
MALLWLWAAYRVGTYTIKESNLSNNSLSSDKIIGRGANAATSCLINHQLECFGAQDSLTYPHPPGYITWIAIFIALVAFVRCIEVRNARSAPISIQVESFLDPENSNGANQKEIHPNRSEISASIVRRVLSSYVQTPPPMPGTAPILSVPAVLNEASPKDGNIITKFLALAWQTAFPERGWKLRGTIEPAPVTPRINPAGVTVQVAERSGNRSIEQRTYWKENFEEASYAAAYGVAQLAIGSSPRLPEWAKWRARMGYGLRMYRDGVDHARGGNFLEATPLLCGAVKADPGNMLAQAEYALALEGSGNYLDALEIYLKLSNPNNEMLQPRYRAAVVMDLVSFWLQDWKSAAGTSTRERLRVALTEANLSVENYPAADASDTSIKEFFLQRSGEQLQRLISSMSYRRLLMKWLPQSGRILYGDFVRPLGTLRPTAKSAILISQCCQELSTFLNKPNVTTHKSLAEYREDSEFPKLEHRLYKALEIGLLAKWAGRRGQLGTSGRNVRVGKIGALENSHIFGLPLYNAACFYARLVNGDRTTSGQQELSNEAATKALDYLSKSLQRSELKEGWMYAIEQDSDFRDLRTHKLYREWFLKRLDG